MKKKIVRIANMIKAMSHPVRLQILEELLEVNDGYNVSTVQKIIKIPQSAISQHLALLRNNGILESKRKGVEIFYYIKDDKMKNFIVSVLEM